MKNLRRGFGAVIVLGLVLAVALVGRETQPAGVKMTDSASKLMGLLSGGQQGKIAFTFDDQERFNWHFVPLEKDKKSTRKGLSLEEMSADQKLAALDLLRAALSDDAYKAATTIMSLEMILREAEKGKGPVRNPEWYFFSIFGTPAKTGKWGWRVEGHHLSLNFVVDQGRIASATPSFYGANPATVKAGDRAGTRAISPVEDAARELVRALDDEQKKIVIQPKDFAEIKAQNKRPEKPTPVGLAAEKMTARQKELLLKLLHAYTDRMPPEIAAEEWKQLHSAGVDKIVFAYSGGANPGDKHTYRVQGPTFLVEYLNIQADGFGNPANHIHSCWRSFTNDFGQGG
jgi:uncharacterized protein DUF3500